MTALSEVSRSGSTILLLTESFPWDGALEDTFVAPLLRPLAAAFERVTIVPLRRLGNPVPLPNGIGLDEGLAERVAKSSNIACLASIAVRSPILWREAAADRTPLRSVRATWRLAATAARGALVRGWVEDRIEFGLDLDQTVAFTFWTSHAAVGLALAKQTFPGLKTATRLNGADLFVERHDPPYIPYQAWTLRSPDLVLAASLSALTYATARFPWLTSSIELFRLGIEDPGFVAAPSSKGHLVMVSCSGVVPVKRVDLIVRAVERVAAARPGWEVEWHHFGDGPLMPGIVRLAESFPANARPFIHGQVPNRVVMQFYRDHPVDVFVNSSASEGGAPMAVVEALGCGVPVVATCVGGNPEAVTNANGRLVDASGNPDDLAAAILAVRESTEEAQLRANARAAWAHSFDASINYPRIAYRLASLGQSRRDVH